VGRATWSGRCAGPCSTPAGVPGAYPIVAVAGGFAGVLYVARCATLIRGWPAGPPPAVTSEVDNVVESAAVHGSGRRSALLSISFHWRLGRHVRVGPEVGELRRQ
jgi:hypothetical protein